MPRISYVGQGSPFRRLLNHAPEVSAAYWSLRTGLDGGAVSAKIRMLTFLASDIENGCRY
jgi:hypothetical protein